MLYSISLDQPNIMCDKLCMEIQKIITKYKSAHPNTSSALVIDIKPVLNSQTDSIPLLEYKPNL